MLRRVKQHRVPAHVHPPADWRPGRWCGPAEAARYVLAVPGEEAERTFDNWQTAATYAASAAARLRSKGLIDEARNVTISEA